MRNSSKPFDSLSSKQRHNPFNYNLPLIQVSTNSTGNTSPASSTSSGPSPLSSWLVLYCGANPKVEEVN